MVQQINQSDQAQDKEEHVPSSKKKKPLNLFKFLENTDTQANSSSVKNEVKNCHSMQHSWYQHFTILETETNDISMLDQVSTTIPCGSSFFCSSRETF